MTSKRKPQPSRALRAEAAAWLARVQISGGDSAVEQGLKEWIAASPEHAFAFESAIDAWEDLGALPVTALKRSAAQERQPAPRVSWQYLAPSLAAVILVVAGIGYVMRPTPADSVLGTQHGEQRTVTLKDGSRVTLNTDSRIEVKAWAAEREVRLERGEVLFEVAKNPEKPFVVVAGDRKVIALGTSFVVRLDADAIGEKVSVTLIEGRVAVADAATSSHAVMTSQVKVPTLAPGQRLTLARSSPAALDRPPMDIATAWRRGELVLEKTPLKLAVAEMNRYGTMTLVVDGDPIGETAVSGIFRTGDSEHFADAVAELYGLEVLKEANRLVISARKP